jgi:hypothetical protein
VLVLLSFSRFWQLVAGRTDILRREIELWDVELGQCGIKCNEIIREVWSRLVIGIRRRSTASRIEYQEELGFKLTWGWVGEILGIAIVS